MRLTVWMDAWVLPLCGLSVWSLLCSSFVGAWRSGVVELELEFNCFSVPVDALFLMGLTRINGFEMSCVFLCAFSVRSKKVVSRMLFTAFLLNGSKGWP